MKTENTNKFCISAIKLCVILNSLHKKYIQMLQRERLCKERDVFFDKMSKQKAGGIQPPAENYTIFYLPPSLSPRFIANAIFIIT